MDLLNSYSMLPIAESPSPSQKSDASIPPLATTRSVPRTDYDIFSEHGGGIPASNFRLLSAWVKHCEHSSTKHEEKAGRFKFLHILLATLSLATVASMTIVSAIVPHSNLATVIQSSVAAFLMGLQNVLDLQGRAKNHLVAEGEFSLMGREIATTLGTIEDERNWNELCRMYQRQMDVIESHAPPI